MAAPGGTCASEPPPSQTSGVRAGSVLGAEPGSQGPGLSADWAGGWTRCQLTCVQSLVWCALTPQMEEQDAPTGHWR